MLATTCPFCARWSHFTIRWGVTKGTAASDATTRVAASCDFCQALSVAFGPSNHVSAESSDPTYVASSLKGHEDTLEWWPKIGVVPTVDDVPTHITNAAREAYSSASVGNHMAAILMARTVVEATAKAKGIKKGVLAEKIEALKDKQLIRPSIAEQAHEIRFMGNDMAHGDIDEQPTPLDSEETLALMAEVLSEVFQGPAKLARLRGRRTAKAESLVPESESES